MRKYRQPSDDVRAKMSVAHTGRTHSEQTKQKISASMTKYWSTIPDAPTTMDSFLGGEQKNKATNGQPIN
jgi:hypothetical protein